VVCGKVSGADTRRRKGQLGPPVRANLAVQRLCWPINRISSSKPNYGDCESSWPPLLVSAQIPLSILLSSLATKHREIGIGQEKVKVATIRRWYHRMMRWVRTKPVQPLGCELRADPMQRSRSSTPENPNIQSGLLTSARIHEVCCSVYYLIFTISVLTLN
jgi:hypothetical protein